MRFLFLKSLGTGGSGSSTAKGTPQDIKSMKNLTLSHSQWRFLLGLIFFLFPLFFYGSNMANALANAICERCRGGFAPAEKIVNSNGELYHEQCFVCAQCFQQFPEGLFYEVSWEK